MIQLTLSLLLVLLHMVIFGLFGVGVGKILKLDIGGLETLLLGFFSFFAVMQFVYLPSMLLKVGFHIFVLIWAVVMLVILGAIVICFHKRIGEVGKAIYHELYTTKKSLFFLTVLIFVILVLFQGLWNHHGFDASFYIGTVNTTLYTDTMYLYNGETGRIATSIDMRYALSGAFYMNTAFWCRILNLPALMVQKYTMGTLTMILHTLVAFLIGRKVFVNNVKHAYLFTSVVLLVNVFFTSSIYTTSTFLLLRTFESKSVGANVVIPAVFYIALCIWKSKEAGSYWKLLFVFSLASVPIAMSMIVILPMMVFVLMVAEYVCKRDKKVLLQGGISLVPNAVYTVLFFLFLQRIWLIQI